MLPARGLCCGGALVLSVQGVAWLITTLQLFCDEALTLSARGLHCGDALVLSVQGFVCLW